VVADLAQRKQPGGGNEIAGALWPNSEHSATMVWLITGTTASEPGDI